MVSFSDTSVQLTTNELNKLTKREKQRHTSTFSHFLDSENENSVIYDIKSNSGNDDNDIWLGLSQCQEGIVIGNIPHFIIMSNVFRDLGF